MEELKEIETEIALLQARLPTIVGRPTEVYSRVVGYYRNENNWNTGKRQEFAERVTFDVPVIKEQK